MRTLPLDECWSTASQTVCRVEERDAVCEGRLERRRVRAGLMRYYQPVPHFVGHVPELAWASAKAAGQIGSKCPEGRRDLRDLGNEAYVNP